MTLISKAFKTLRKYPIRLFFVDITIWTLYIQILNDYYMDVGSMQRVFDWYSVMGGLNRAGYRELLEFQAKAIKSFISGQDILVKVPTGSGKTLIPLIYATLMIGIGKRCLYVMSTRRLITQTYNRLVTWFDSLPHYRGKYSIVRVTGDDRLFLRNIKKAEIIVTTFESLNGLLIKNYEYSLLKKVGLIIVDEMQYIGKINRLEDAIVKIRSRLHPPPQTLYLTVKSNSLRSATVEII